MFKHISKIIAFALLLLLLPVLSFAKNDSIPVYQGTIGVSVGTDIGGAIPFPVSNIPGTINAYPQINASIGAKFGFTLVKGWGIGAEINYKTIGMKADARVNNQKFNMDDATMYFSGTTKTEMKFTILEVPLYAKYHFRDGKNVVYGGLYYSHVFSGTFIADPTKGYVGARQDMVEITDMSSITMDFTPYLDNWDLGFLVGYERKIYDRLNLSIRFSMGFKDIFEPSSHYFDYNMLNMRGGIAISYDLFKSKSLFKRKVN